MKKISAFAVAATVGLITACNGGTQPQQGAPSASGEAPEQPALAANTLCQVDQSFDISHCNNGNRFLFQPSRFGSEQLPLVVIANFCDIQHPVHFNNGGVVCIFKRL